MAAVPGPDEGLSAVSRSRSVPAVDLGDLDAGAAARVGERITRCG
ncbi:hypothetical protein [Micromonospora wenchangensis]|nr:hypothetical protein [Micromonospora wenchangensis]